MNLIALNENHVNHSNWFNWFNSERTTKFMQKHYFPNSRQKQLDFIKSVNSADLFVLGIHDGTELIGVCSIDEINHYNRNCSLSIIIGEKIKDEKLTLEVFYRLIIHCFESLNLRKVKIGQHIGLKLFNAQLKHYFGFEREGLLKEELYKGGKYNDVILSSLFKEKFYNNQERIKSYLEI